MILILALASCNPIHTQIRDDNHLLVTSYSTSYGQVSCIRGLCCFPYKHRADVGDNVYAMACVDEQLTKELNLAELQAFVKVYIP